MKTSLLVCGCLFLFLLGCGTGDEGTEDASSDTLVLPS